MNFKSKCQELMKGCDKEFIWVTYLKDSRLCGQIEDLKHSTHIIYCPSCKVKQQAYKEIGKDWLEFLKNDYMLNCIHKADYGACHEKPNWYLDEIKDLEEGLKILENEK